MKWIAIPVRRTFCTIVISIHLIRFQYAQNTVGFQHVWPAKQTLLLKQESYRKFTKINQVLRYQLIYFSTPNYIFKT
jgi:hypothetical protein